MPYNFNHTLLKTRSDTPIRIQSESRSKAHSKNLWEDPQVPYIAPDKVLSSTENYWIFLIPYIVGTKVFLMSTTIYMYFVER